MFWENLPQRPPHYHFCEKAGVLPLAPSYICCCLWPSTDVDKPSSFFLHELYHRALFLHSFPSPLKLLLSFFSIQCDKFEDQMTISLTSYPMDIISQLFFTVSPLGSDYMQMGVSWGNSQIVASATLSTLLLSFPLHPK